MPDQAAEARLRAELDLRRLVVEPELDARASNVERGVTRENDLLNLRALEQRVVRAAEIAHHHARVRGLEVQMVMAYRRICEAQPRSVGGAHREVPVDRAGHLARLRTGNDLSCKLRNAKREGRAGSLQEQGAGFGGQAPSA